MKIWIGADEPGAPLKDVLKARLDELGIEYVDVGDATRSEHGEPRDYPDVGLQVALAVQRGEADRGILCCGTGIGMAITANKVEGVRAATCHDVYSAQRARMSNNAQVLTMGARVIGPEAAKAVLDSWLQAEFGGGASARKVARVDEIERQQRGPGLKKLINRADRVVDDMVSGFVACHVGRIELVPGTSRAIRRCDLPPQRVGVLTGGGSGHEPAFMGLVGAGMADAAVIGNVFASPGVDPIVSAIAGIDRGSGVVQILGNYAGDVMNFGLAAEMASGDGIPVATVLVTDDVASASANQAERRRGIAGDLIVVKAAGACAAQGGDLDAVAGAARLANERTRTMGVGLAPCVHPDTGQPSFSLGPDEVEWGLGIHGEPGVRKGQLCTANETVDILMSPLLEELQPARGDRVALLINGLGSTTQMELYTVAGRALDRLKERGIVAPLVFVGSFVTSMEMAGVSITLTLLSAELEGWLEAPARAAGFSFEKVNA